MVLPGIQALFGFQLIVVFSDGFNEYLTRGERVAHLCAILLVAVSIALIMTPAAYDRRAGPREVTDRFLRFSTAMLLGSMLPLALAIALDFYLIAQLILESTAVAAVLAATLFVVYVGLWYGLPLRLAGGRGAPDGQRRSRKGAVHGPS